MYTGLQGFPHFRNRFDPATFTHGRGTWISAFKCVFSRRPFGNWKTHFSLGTLFYNGTWRLGWAHQNLLTIVSVALTIPGCSRLLGLCSPKPWPLCQVLAPKTKFNFRERKFYNNYFIVIPFLTGILSNVSNSNIK